MPRKDPEICKKIRDRRDKWDKYWRINRTQYHEFTGFILGDQWREDESKLFERYNKIPLSFNKLGVLMNHLLTDKARNTPTLEIEPEGNVPAKTAEIYAALVKQITLNSDAKQIYLTAYGQAVVGGFGAYGVGTRYVNNHTFDQEIYFFDFHDPTRCYWDISAKSPCKTDGMYSGYAERVSRTHFRSIYGKKIEQDIGANAFTEDSALEFPDADEISIIYDYERIDDTKKIYQLSDVNQTVIEEEDYKKLERQEIDGIKMLIYNGEPVTVINKREVPQSKIKMREIAGDYILNEEDFPSEQLPIIFVDQKSYYDKYGQQITRSFFQDVKDAQRFLNYLATQMSYFLKVSRYDQFMAPRKSIQAPDTQAIWRDPSAQQGALVYDETPEGNKPEQLRPPELSMSLMQQYERTLMDIQSGTGMFNTQLGEMGNEVSGRAIDARTERGSFNTNVPSHSLNVAITCGGQIVNEMIPYIYDTERLMRLSTPEASNQPVMLNQQVDQYGMQMENDMTEGRYRVRLVVGPSTEGQKQEALESLQLVLAADKSGQVFPMIADLYVENLPLENNIELRNRLRTIVPPEIIEAGKTGKPLPPKPQQPSPDMVEAQLKQQELQHKMQQAQVDAQMRQKELELKQAELQRKAIETHQDVTMQWEKLQAEKEEAAAQLQETMLRYQAEQQRVAADMQINHAGNIIKLLTHHPKEPKEKKPTEK